MIRLCKHGVAVFSALAFLSACSVTSKEMPFSESNGFVDTSSTPVMLLTLSFENKAGRDVMTSLQSITVRRIDKPDSKPEAFKVAFEEISTDTERYLLRFTTGVGEYEILNAAGVAYDGSILNSKPFVVPLHLALTSQSQGVHYLGHINATLRPRQENEFFAGPVATSGGSSGSIRFSRTARLSDMTFDVIIDDEMSSDIKRYKAKFPALTNEQINKQILPPFDRPKVEKIMAESEARGPTDPLLKLFGKK